MYVNLVLFITHTVLRLYGLKAAHFVDLAKAHTAARAPPFNCDSGTLDEMLIPYYTALLALRTGVQGG